jgi:hypothetical protein
MDCQHRADHQTMSIQRPPGSIPLGWLTLRRIAATRQEQRIDQESAQQLPALSENPLAKLGMLCPSVGLI